MPHHRGCMHPPTANPSMPRDEKALKGVPCVAAPFRASFSFRIAVLGRNHDSLPIIPSFLSNVSLSPEHVVPLTYFGRKD
jgi:hypothetical protein